MSCYHPLKGYPIGVNPSGKTKYKIASYDSDHVELVGDHWQVCNTDFTSKYATRVVTDFLQIPCGRCIGCRLDYSRQWANRCVMELPYHDQSWFVTLTYDDNHLPITEYVLLETGEIGQCGTLVKRDVQLFLKRLRKAYTKNSIKFFCAGEYGDQTLRPHYHLILFGLRLDDLKLWKQSLNGYNYYNSQFLSGVWQKGHVVIGEVTWETCAYTARYIMKKQYGDNADFYDTYNVTPEFTSMSLKPAIGRRFFEDHYEEISRFDNINVSTPQGGRSFRPPKYFDKLLEQIDCERLSELKRIRRMVSESLTDVKMSNTSVDYLEQLLIEEDVKSRRIKALKRGEI